MRLYPPFLLLFGIIAIFISGCSDNNKIYNPPPVKTIDDAIREEILLVAIEDSQLPNIGFSLESARELIAPYDAEGIELFEYRGGYYYHPVYMGHRILNFINSYKASGDSTLLVRAEKYAEKLMTLAHIKDSVAYLPYSFRFAVHSDSTYLLEPPWFSGMAQGEFLTILCRLYRMTGKESYRQFADLIFNSFLQLRGTSANWVARVDNDNYYWIEEYPHYYYPGQTLNGFITAVYGVYDYARLSERKQAKYIYQLSMTTLKHYLPQYRRADTTSYYCLGHYHPADNAYHQLHISMLGYLYLFSNDPFFLEMQSLFEADF